MDLTVVSLQLRLDSCLSLGPCGFSRLPVCSLLCCCPTCGAVNFREGMGTSVCDFSRLLFFLALLFNLGSFFGVFQEITCCAKQQQQKREHGCLSSLCTYTMPPKYVTVWSSAAWENWRNREVPFTRVVEENWAVVVHTCVVVVLWWKSVVNLVS